MPAAAEDLREPWDSVIRGIKGFSFLVNLDIPGVTQAVADEAGCQGVT